MKEGWRLARLGDVCSFEKEQDVHAGLPYVGLENIESGTGRFLGATNAVSVKSATFRFSSAHVLYGRLRPYLNKVLLPEFDGHCSTEIFPIRVGRELSREYLFYWLSMDATVKSIDATSTGARMPRANMSAVLDFEIPLPPPPEQRRIVAMLDEAFEAISTAKINAEKNLLNARELFEAELQSTFGGDPEATGLATLGSVCKFVGGSQPPKSEFVGEPRDGYVRLIQIRDYKSDKKAVYIPKGLARRFCAADDVMIGRYGPPLFQILRGLEGAYNVALMKAVPDETVLSKSYLFHFLRHRDMRSYIIASSARAAGQIGLNKETIEPYPIHIPNLRAQDALVSRIEQLEDATNDLARIAEQKLAALDDLKKSLLQQAFSGTLMVMDNERQLESVA